MLLGLNYDEKDSKFILLGNVFKCIENKKAKDIYNLNGVNNKLLFVKCLKIFFMHLYFCYPIIGVVDELNKSEKFRNYMGFMNLAPGILLMGVGIGLALSLNTDISLMSTKAEDQDTDSGVLNTGHSLGSSLGTAIIGCILIVGATWRLHD